MDDKIFIGLIIGLIVFIISSVVKSNKYNSLQKFYLVVSCIIFLPLGLVLLLMTYLYTNQSNISSNKHLEKPQAIKKENSVLNKLDFINSNEKDEFNLNLNFQKNKSIDISQYMTDLSQYKTDLKDLETKLKLLRDSFENNLLNKNEYQIKYDEINKTISYTKDQIERERIAQNEKEIEKKILIKNSELIYQLDKLLDTKLIDKETYDLKKNKILKDAKREYKSSLSVKQTKNFKVINNKFEISSFGSWLVLILLIIFIIQLIKFGLEFINI